MGLVLLEAKRAQPVDLVLASTDVEADPCALAGLDVGNVFVPAVDLATCACELDVQVLGFLQVPLQVLFVCKVFSAVGIGAGPARAPAAVVCCDMLQGWLDVDEVDLTWVTVDRTRPS